MNIAFVSDVAYPFVKGGGEKRIHEIGVRLAEKGHHITVYTRHWWDGPQTITHKGIQLRGVSPARNLYSSGDRRSITEALEFAKDVIKPLYEQKATHDIVSGSLAPYFHVFSSKFATVGSNTPLVTTWHEVWDGYWYKYMGKLGIAGKTVERVAAHVPHYPIAVSEMTASKLNEISPRRNDITVIPNGIDVGQVTQSQPTENGYDVLFVGRLIKDKNVHLLLDAFDEVATEYDITLGIIGDGPQFEPLQQQITTLSNQDQVSLLGFVEDYEDVLSHMQAADLFVSPSVREGFGITFIEAMAAGCTVITVDDPYSAASEVVGEAGFIINVSAAEIAETMRQVLDGERPAKDPVKHAKQYDWDRIVTEEEQFYQTLI